MRIQKSFVFKALLCLSSLILLACVSPVSAETGTYEKIKARGEIRIGISMNYPPLNFNSGEKGVEMEMAKKLGNFLDCSVKFVPLPVSEYISALEEGKVDILMSGLSRNMVRAKKIWYSVPYLTLTPAVLVRKAVLPQTQFGEQFEQRPFETIFDLRRLNSFTFALKKGSTYEVLLSEKFPDFPQVIVANDEEGLKKVEDGEAQGFVHDSLYLQYMYSKDAKLKRNYQLLSGGRIEEHLSIGLPFGAVILKNQIDIFIQELQRQGLLDEWLENFSK